MVLGMIVKIKFFSPNGFHFYRKAIIMESVFLQELMGIYVDSKVAENY